MEESKTFPLVFLCPFSHKPLKNPVTDSEGITYENEEILKHLIDNSTSPITGKPLKISDLVTNSPLKIAYRDTIKEI